MRLVDDGDPGAKNIGEARSKGGDGEHPSPAPPLSVSIPPSQAEGEDVGRTGRFRESQ